ncbi:MAG TPA: hypothetical protein VMV69_13750, partial [Pirellulales bacterium]|nr:hypothetical protein [Pirellulales bacterium]
MASGCGNSPASMRPPTFVVSFAGTCCKCGTKADSSPCGGCQESAKCASCDRFNGYFRLALDENNTCRYFYDFTQTSGIPPCSAQTLELLLTNHTDPTRVNVCIRLTFSDPSLRPVSWGKTGVRANCNIGVLRRRTTNRQCCWPLQITVTPVPLPDFVPPQPEWFRGDPDDLNDAPFWPSLGFDTLEDSDYAPLRYYNGELQLRVKDVASGGYGIPWGHTRIWSNRLSNSYDFGQGYNWTVLEWPQLVLVKSDMGAQKTGCTVVLLRGTRNALWFEESAMGQNQFVWQSLFGAKHQFQHFPEEKLFRIAAPNGHVWEFYDFTSPNSKAFSGMPKSQRAQIAPGRFKRHIGPGGQTVTAQWENCQLQSVTRGGPQGSAVGDETYEYEWLQKPDPNAGRLATITLAGPMGNIGRVDYDYYGENDDNG